MWGWQRETSCFEEIRVCKSDFTSSGAGTAVTTGWLSADGAAVVQETFRTCSLVLSTPARRSGKKNPIEWELKHYQFPRLHVTPGAPPTNDHILELWIIFVVELWIIFIIFWNCELLKKILWVFYSIFTYYFLTGIHILLPRSTWIFFIVDICPFFGGTCRRLLKNRSLLMHSHSHVSRLEVHKRSHRFLRMWHIWFSWEREWYSWEREIPFY